MAAQKEFPHIYLTFIFKNKKRKYYHAPKPKWRRLYSRIASANFLKSILKVQYGIFENVLGKKEMFENKGVYTNKRDLKKSLKAFLEVDLNE